MEIDVKRVKIFVTIPVDYTEKVRDAVCKAGAGVIGNYTYCTTATKSLGTFIPNEKANAFIGTKNKLEYVQEDKLEFVCDIDKVGSALKSLKETHPYEEPAIDIIPLLDCAQFE